MGAQEVWILEYIDWDWHENIVVCATKEIAEREKQKHMDHDPERRYPEGFVIHPYLVMTE